MTNAISDMGHYKIKYNDRIISELPCMYEHEAGEVARLLHKILPGQITLLSEDDVIHYGISYLVLEDGEIIDDGEVYISPNYHDEFIFSIVKQYRQRHDDVMQKLGKCDLEYLYEGEWINVKGGFKL